MIGVNGLTCSACTRSVELSIRKLNFVKDVNMNLENTEGKIVFYDSLDADIEKVAKAVENAGFSVRYLKAIFDFSNVTIQEGYCFNDGKNQFEFIKTEQRELHGNTELTFIGSDYQPKSEFNKFKPLPKLTCTDNKIKVYYVTL